MQCNGIREHITYNISSPGFRRLHPGYTRCGKQIPHFGMPIFWRHFSRLYPWRPVAC